MKLDKQLAIELREVRLRNARRINLLRVIGTAAYATTNSVMLYGLDSENWEQALLPTVGYLAVALVFLIGGGTHPKILWISRFAIPIIDMPAVFAIQLIHLRAMELGSRGHVSEFSVALFVCLLLLSAFTLNRGQVIISLVLAIVFEQILQAEARMTAGAHISSTMVLCFVTWICFYAGQNRVRLAETMTRIDARRMRLQRYFWPGVGEILEEREEDNLALGQECELTVVFADIRGFTALSEHLSGRDVIQLLNTFHASMVEAVFRQGGTLDKYLGDGLMFYFNAPVAQPDHAERALRCAMAMEIGLASLNTVHAGEGHVPLQMGIGIHTGRAIVGDIGAPHRREFTAIGTAVNIAARLEEMTKELGVGVLVSEATAMLVGDCVAWSDVGEFPVRGCLVPLRLLTPRAATPC